MLFCWLYYHKPPFGQESIQIRKYVHLLVSFLHSVSPVVTEDSLLATFNLLQQVSNNSTLIRQELEKVTDIRDALQTFASPHEFSILNDHFRSLLIAANKFDGGETLRNINSWLLPARIFDPE